MSRELRTRLIQFKIINRVYWTPSRLNKVGLLDSLECCRCHDKDSTQTHKLWSCPRNFGSSALWLFILADPSALSWPHSVLCWLDPDCSYISTGTCGPRMHQHHLHGPYTSPGWGPFETGTKGFQCMESVKAFPAHKSNVELLYKVWCLYCNSMASNGVTL